jgi:hypothetical protein
MEVRADRQQLASLTCAASRQLGADSSERWPEENSEFLTLRQRLVDAGCLPPPPQDPCALATNIAALLPSTADGDADLADESPAEILIDLQ